jgi:fused-like protein
LSTRQNPSNCKTTYKTPLTFQNNEFTEAVLDSGIWETICFQLNVSTTENELSPSGLSSAVHIIYEVLCYNPPNNLQLLATNNMLPALISVVDSSHFDRLVEWPFYLQGGLENAPSLITLAAGIFYKPLQNENGIDVNLLDLLIQIMLNCELVPKLVSTVKFLPPELLEMPVVVILQLVLRDKGILKQFVENGGLDSKLMLYLLKETNPSEAIADALLIISQLARTSKTYYENIHAANMYSCWLKLLSHENAVVRAKTCNLIGNLCKFSAYFYAELKK